MAESERRLVGCDTNSSSSPETYAKRKATGASFAGHMYEIKMLALLYLRLGNSDIIHEFRLATNHEGLIPLDDVVLSYTTIEEPTTVRTIFIQLKHRIKKKMDAYMFKSAYGDFYLRCYLKAFSRIKEMFASDEDEKPVLFRGSFEKCQFLIYTPAPEGKLFGKVSRNVSENEIDVLLKTGSGTDIERKEKVFKFNKEIDEEIFTLLGDSELGKQFLKMLRVFAGQALESELDAKIKNALTKKTPAEIIDAVYRSYLEAFQRWWSESNVILDRNSDILNKCVDECKLGSLSLKGETRLRGVKFKSEHLFDVNALDENTFVHIVTPCSAVRLSCTKLQQSLLDVKGGYIFLSLDALLKETEIVLSAWNSEGKDRLVIVSRSTSQYGDVCNMVDKHLQEFSNLKRNNKKLILVSVEDDPFVSNLKQTLSDGKTCQAVHDGFQLAQLETECKEMIVESEVLFQGECVRLREILGEEGDLVTDVVNDELVRRVMNENRVKLGVPVPEKDLAYYIPRTLERHDIVDERVFGREADDVFVVRGVTKQELMEMVPSIDKVGVVGGEDEKCRFLAVESDTYIARELGRKENTHELRLSDVDGCLRWISTNGSDALVREFITRDCVTPYNPDTALDLEGRLVLLIAEPGMGKTTLVTHLASTTKATHPQYWIVRVNLRDHKKLLENMCDDAVGFLTSAAGVDSSTARLFRHVVETTGKCVVFLDGFDEIAPKYTGRGLSLVRSVLTRTGVRKVYVTARHAMRNTLESEFSTRAFALRKFDGPDQETFFERFWSRNDCSDVTCGTRRLIRHLVELIGRSLNDAGKEFMGVPLQAMMLAEIYEEHYKRNATVADLPEKLNVLTMFEKVIDKKFEIYLRRRFPGAEDIESEMKKLSKSVYKEHMYASLEFLLGRAKINGLHKGKKISERNEAFYKEINTSDNKTGIIIEVLNGRPVFLHRTFAEYFAARWFSVNFVENRAFLRENLFDVAFNVIRSRFDLILAGSCNLLAAVVNNEVNNVRSLLISDDSEVNVRDLGGRSALHLAAVLDAELRYGRPEDKPLGPQPQTMVGVLLECGAHGFDVDDVTGWGPLTYAVNAKAWGALEDLLACGKASEDDLTMLQARLTNRHVAERARGNVVVRSTLMHALSARGYAKTVAVLGREGVWARDGTDRTALHVACRWGEVRVASVLIRLVEEQDEKLEVLRGNGVNADRSKSPDVITIVSDDDDASESPAASESSDDDDKEVSRLEFRRSTTSAREYVNSLGDRDNVTPLHLASRHGHSDLVRLLVSKMANVWTGDAEERTPLHAACEYGSETSVKILVSSLGDDRKALVKYVNKLSRSGRTALHEAAECGALEVVEVLVSSGCDVTIADGFGNTALHYACGRGEEQVARVLIGALGEKAAVSRYVNAVNSSDDWTVKREGVSALQLASRRGHGTLVRYLLPMGGLDACWTPDQHGGTLLHDACRRGDVTTARVLVDSLGDDVEEVEVYVNDRDDYGRRARDVALEDTDCKLRSEDEGIKMVEYLDSLIDKCSEH